MEQQYGDDFISITDEDGKEYELEVLAELEHDGSRYLALVPAGSGDDEAEEDEAAAENRLQQRFGAGHRIGRQRRQCQRHSHPEIDVAEKRRARGIGLRGGKGRFGCFHFRVE